MSSDTPARLEAFADRLRRRIALGTWLRGLHASAAPLFIAALLGAALLFMAFGLRGPLLPFALLVVMLWGGVTAIVAFARAPTRSSALATFDRETGSGECLLSAHSFVRTDAQGPGVELHLLRAMATLQGALDHVHTALPLPRSTRTVVLPLAFLVASLLPRALPGPEETQRQTPPAARTSQTRAADRTGAPTPRPASPDAPPDPPGEAVLAALERHAETARIAQALRAQDGDRAGSAIDKLARRLRMKGLSDDARQRVARALREGLAEADSADRKSEFGRRADEAQRALQAGRRADAAAALEALARKWRRAAGRMRRGQALAAVAASLRGSKADGPGLVDARSGTSGRGPARIGIGTAPYEPRPGTTHAARRDERVNARAGRSLPGARARTGTDPVGAPSAPGAMTVGFEGTRESAVPDAAIPPSLRDAVRRYFASLRADSRR